MIREKILKTLSYKKAADKMLVKSTPGDQKLSVPIEASSTRFLDQAEKQSNSVITVITYNLKRIHSYDEQTIIVFLVPIEKFTK